MFNTWTCPSSSQQFLKVVHCGLFEKLLLLLLLLPFHSINGIFCKVIGKVHLEDISSAFLYLFRFRIDAQQNQSSSSFLPPLVHLIVFLCPKRFHCPYGRTDVVELFVVSILRGTIRLNAIVGVG